MTLTIRVKIILICVAIVFIAVGGSTTFDSIFFVRQYSRALESGAFAIGSELVSQLDRLLRLKIPLDNLVGFDEQCRDLVAKYGDLSYAMVIDLTGKILFHNDSSMRGKMLSDPNLLSAIRSGKNVSQTYFGGGEPSHDFVIPVFGLQGEHLAAVRIGFPFALISEKTKSMVCVSVSLGLLSLGIGIILLAIALKIWVTNPLSKLVSAIQDVREKGADSAPLVQIDTKDELGQLASHFGEMILEIRESHDRLRNHAQLLEAKVKERTADLKAANTRLVQDIVKRREIEKELRESRQQLSDLSAYLQSAIEQERANIAREIHDDLGQNLTALTLDISWLRKRLPEDQSALIEKMNSMSKVIKASLQTVKRLSMGLRPRILDDLGLTAAAEWMVGEFQKRTGITCHTDIDIEDSVLDQERSNALFRILQEALTNIARHAAATEAEIILKKDHGHVILQVIDNGKGIKQSEISGPKSFGLMGMRERVRILNGEVKIRGVENWGTTIRVTIPLQHDPR
ncbi:MAG: HAMP domain-containing protein [Deltaproteobacteria bacterium]|nr:HAMP domain-containing protein [Deltaproteobacteria bacterium]MBW2137203.1 HAMP domain-containing protein [Deltaproteobacteria bacterium]